MDRVELAERHYREIADDNLHRMERSERYWSMPIAEFVAWIDNYVVPAVEEIYQRPQFRDHATWPQRVLVRGADTRERSAVERVDRALVAEATALRKLFSNRLVARTLEEMTSSLREEPTSCSTRIGSEGSVKRLSRCDPRQFIPYYAAKTEKMGQRDWTDLVCVDDYFVPTGDMMRKTPLPEGVTEGAFVVSLSPHLFQVGDSITRCMMQRIRSMLEFLTEARQVVYQAIHLTGRPYANQVKAERETHQQLHQSHSDLQIICLTGPDARVREACVTLVQVYAEFHPAPDLGWLGVSNWAIKRSKTLLRHNIESLREFGTLDRVAAALGDLKHVYRDSHPELSAIDTAIGLGALVLIEGQREAYWERQLIKADWLQQKKAWQMLWKLAANARIASPVSDIDLYQEPVSDSTMHNRLARLKRLLPPSLSRLISVGVERATYRLDLAINKISLFN